MEALMSLLERNQQQLNDLSKELAASPAGSLREKDGVFYQVLDRKFRSLRKYPVGFDQLCRKKLVALQLPALKKNVYALSLALESMSEMAPEGLLKQLSKGYHGIPIHHFYHPDALIFMREKYEVKTFREDEKVFTTTKGLKVRSKSEWMIATLLEQSGLLFRYEAKIWVNGVEIHPDFIIMNPFTGEIFIWEHFGGLAFDGYGGKVDDKIFLFQKAGYKPFKNFFFTFEADTKIAGRLESLIEQMLRF